MKKIIDRFMKSFIMAAIALGTVLVSCNKDYLDDTGVHNPVYEGNIFQYLQSKPDYFDSLTKIITLAGMEKVFTDSTITFFAPPEQTIMSSVHLLNSYLYLRAKDTVQDLSQIDPTVWRRMLSMYVLPGKYVQKDFPQLDTTLLQTYPGQGYISWAGRAMNVGVIFNDAGGVKYAGLRKLCYSYVRNPGDVSGNGMINEIVASSDIQPDNGAVHVLRLHDKYFGFDPNLFIQLAVSMPISEFKSN